MKVIAYGEVFECSRAVKGGNFIILYDEQGVAFTRFEGINSFDSYSIIDGEWESATPKPIVMRNVTTGELITINGQLYKAIANIPNGGLVIEGQNAVKTTYEAELFALQKGE